MKVTPWEVSGKIDYEKLIKQFGVKAQVSYGPPKTGDVRHSLADIELARRVLGYSPTINIEEGLRLMMEAMRGRKPC